MCQAPLGLWHLQGSMQSLSESLRRAIERDGGQVLLRHRVQGLQRGSDGSEWRVQVVLPDGSQPTLHASDVICSLPPQCGLHDLWVSEDRVNILGKSTPVQARCLGICTLHEFGNARGVYAPCCQCNRGTYATMVGHCCLPVLPDLRCQWLFREKAFFWTPRLDSNGLTATAAVIFLMFFTNKSFLNVFDKEQFC